MLVELPCGILHNSTVYDRVVIKELTGRQQNYLVNLELTTNNIGHIPKMLEELTDTFQTAEGLPLDMPKKDLIWKLTSEDVEFILLKIRERTYGPVLALPTACPHCSKQQTKRIDLDKLEVTQLKDKNCRTKEIELPKSKMIAIVKLMYLKDLFELFKIYKDKQTTLYTSTLMVSLEKLGEKETITEEDLMALSLTDLQAIEKAFGELRSSIDTTIINECDSCEKEYTVGLPVTDPSFFVQSTIPST